MSFYYVYCNNAQVNMIIERIFKTNENAQEWSRLYASAWYTPPRVVVKACEAKLDDNTQLWHVVNTDQFRTYLLNTFTDAQIEEWEQELVNLRG